MNVVIHPAEIRAAAQAEQGSIVIQPQVAAVEADPADLSISLGNPVIRELTGGEAYTGSYTVTPARAAQILPTAGKLPARDIVVEAIPQNYGLITWNGSVLTVS